MIRKKDLINFSGNPKEDLIGQVIAVKGAVWKLGQLPAMTIEREAAIDMYKL